MKGEILKRKKRIRKKISGNSKKPRLSVFRSNNHIYAQAIDDEKGITLVSCNDLSQKKKSTRIEIAKAVGLDLGKKLSKKKIKEAIFDRSGYRYHGRVKALAEGVREAGIKF